jgi:hypothetical protein
MREHSTLSSADPLEKSGRSDSSLMRQADDRQTEVCRRAAHSAGRWAIIILLGLASPPAQAPAQTGWTQKEFILGTFYDPPFYFKEQKVERDLAAFKLAKDCNFNLLSGTQDPSRIDHSFEGMKYALTLANRLGLQYMVADGRYYPAYDFDLNESVARAMVAQYKKLPANLRQTMYAYNLCDEPHYTEKHIKRVSDWVRFLEAQDPEKLVYVNLVASYAPGYSWGGFKGRDNGEVGEPEKRSYEDYLTKYIDNLKPGVICFDHYPFFKNGNVRRDYYYNLSVIRSKAKGTPFWAVPMTVDHLVYADPTEAQLSIMYFAPIAYGAKGLIVFTFWELPAPDYRLALIDKYGKPTRNYPVVKRLNLFVRKVLAPVVMNVPNVAVYHASKFPNEQQNIDAEIAAPSRVVGSIGHRSLLIGVFADTTQSYLFVVNKSQDPLTNVPVSVKGNVSEVSFAPRVVGFAENTKLTYTTVATRYDSQSRSTVFTIPALAGGEGKLIRVGK